MPSERADEAVLVNYLLGNLSETEQEQVEDRAFADADYRNALEASEADLIDTYVRGGLSQSERRAFERRFLTSTNRRSKVEFARALAKAAAESTQPEQRAQRQTFISLLSSWMSPLRAATAFAAFVCVAGTSWLLFQNVAMRSQIGVLESQRRELQTQQDELRRKLTVEEQNRGASPAAPQQSVI